MNTTTKLQVFAGISAVIALPLLYFGLHSGSHTVPVIGLLLFLLAMLVTPVLRILPSNLTTREDSADV